MSVSSEFSERSSHKNIEFCAQDSNTLFSVLAVLRIVQVCNILPEVEYVSRPGSAEQSGNPKACSALRSWLNSDDSRGWQRNPDASISSTIQYFLDGLLDAIGCANMAIWSACHSMESAQGHLALTGGQPNDELSSDDTFEPKSADEGWSSELEGDQLTATGSEPSCFPGSAKVELESGSTVAMRNLRIGDSVRVSSTEYSKVYVFSHRDAHATAQYLRISAGNSSIVMTLGHLLPVNGGQLAPAAAVTAGDRIQSSSGKWTAVTSVRPAFASGLYNPHTLQGEIVVDGICVSTYTTAVPVSLAKTLLAPIRGMHALGLVKESLFIGWLSHWPRPSWLISFAMRTGSHLWKDTAPSPLRADSVLVVGNGEP